MRCPSLQYSQGLVLAVLQHDDGDIAILIEDEVELELRGSLVELVERNEGSGRSLGQAQETDQSG
jgi:hypothetical protein